MRYVAYAYLLLDLILPIVLFTSKEHEASHYTELSSRLSLKPSPGQTFSTAPRSRTPRTSLLPLMWRQMGTSFLNTLRSASFQGERILQPSSVMQIAWTPHTSVLASPPVITLSCSRSHSDFTIKPHEWASATSEMMTPSFNFGHVGIRAYTRSMRPALFSLTQKLRQSQMALLLIGSQARIVLL